MATRPRLSITNCYIRASDNPIMFTDDLLRRHNGRPRFVRYDRMTLTGTGGGRFTAQPRQPLIRNGRKFT